MNSHPTHKSRPAKPAAFFDMDRTLLRIDSGMSWMRFLRRRGELSAFGMARAVYWSVLYKLAILDIEALATRLTADIQGDSVDEMIAKCAEWYRTDIVHEVAPKARHAIDHHRAAGDQIVILTGATQFIAEVVAGSLDIDHTLCTRLQIQNGRFTGRLDALCVGENKVDMAESLAREAAIDIDRSTFYSDSYNDVPMLERVGTPVAVNPDARLRRRARSSGWRIERWA